jgi:aconitate hydratase
MSSISNPFSSQRRTLAVSGRDYTYYAFPEDPRVPRLPHSIRVLLEAAIRNCDGLKVTKEDVDRIIDWQTQQHNDIVLDNNNNSIESY